MGSCVSGLILLLPRQIPVCGTSGFGCGILQPFILQSCLCVPSVRAGFLGWTWMSNAPKPGNTHLLGDLVVGGTFPAFPARGRIQSTFKPRGSPCDTAVSVWPSCSDSSAPCGLRLRPFRPARRTSPPSSTCLGLVPQVQGSDTCSLHAVASLAEFELAKRDPRPDSQRSTEFLIWAAKKATGKDHDQAMFYEAVCGLNRFGICREALMPEAGPGHPRRAAVCCRLGRRPGTEQPLAGPWIKRWTLSDRWATCRCGPSRMPWPTAIRWPAVCAGPGPQGLRGAPGAAAECGGGRS